MNANTVFLRLEGPLQSWGDTSKFVIRRTMEAPTKSGVLGLVCCAMGLSRRKARDTLPRLNELVMAVRIDRPGTRWWDWHTVGAGTGLTTAGGGLKTGAQGTLVTRREYLADASFLVALQGDPALVGEVAAALQCPKWPVFLGRKSCPPSAPVFARSPSEESWSNPASYPDLKMALAAVPWHPRTRTEADKVTHQPKKTLEVLVEWRAHDGETAPLQAEVWYDVPFSFDPPAHHPRLVLRTQVGVPVRETLQQPVPPPPRPRADYTNSEYKKRRDKRLKADNHLCVFCKSPATTVQHVTYRRAGGQEAQSDLRSLCRLCHDAVTMIEYGLGMGLDRIDPEDARWREDIRRTRKEILEWRNEEHRRRALRWAPSDVRRDLLEAEE